MKTQLENLTLAANDASLPYLLIGGHAVILYSVPRFTRDIDFLVSTEVSIEWRQLLESLGYTFCHATKAFAQFDPPKETDLAGVDLMIVDEDTWRKLDAEVVEKELDGGVVVRLPRVLHLIAMKLAASNSAHRRADAVDFSDVVRLIRVNEMDINDSETVAVIEKYGGGDTLTRLREEFLNE